MASVKVKRAKKGPGDLSESNKGQDSFRLPSLKQTLKQSQKIVTGAVCTECNNPSQGGLGLKKCEDCNHANLKTVFDRKGALPDTIQQEHKIEKSCNPKYDVNSLFGYGCQCGAHRTNMQQKCEITFKWNTVDNTCKAVKTIDCRFKKSKTYSCADVTKGECELDCSIKLTKTKTSPASCDDVARKLRL